jgi:hypothetical protein
MHPFTASGCIESFGGRGLDGDPCHGQSAHLGDPLAHQVLVREDLRRLQHHRDIDVDRCITLGRKQADGMLYEQA